MSRPQSQDRPAIDARALRERIGEPRPLAANKEMPRLDEHCRRFIALSPFLCLGTANAAGRQTVSPRGDAPGFVRVLDDRTLLIPDRPGNQRVESMRNVLEQAHVGVLFFLPGVEETLRVSGRARVTDDPDLLAASTVNGKAPAVGIVIAVDEVYFHCAKALKRSRLWDTDARIARQDFPSYGRIVRDQRQPDRRVEEIETLIEEDYRTRLY